MTSTRILAIHGINRHEPGGPWEGLWRDAIGEGVAGAGHAPDDVSVDFVHYDDLFEDVDVSFLDAMEALAKLVAGGLRGALGSRGRFGRDVRTSLRWSAGMVVKWVEDDAFRAKLRDRLAARIAETTPDVVIGHSMGSLIAYDAFTMDPSLVGERSFLSVGSQIGNHFVVGQFMGGRIQPLDQARLWLHQYNPHDGVFTAPVRLPAAPNFVQVVTPFDARGAGADHRAESYFRHAKASDDVWPLLIGPQANARRQVVAGDLSAPASREVKVAGIARRVVPKRRALLVGINEYPDDAMRLAGCKHDVFLMSEALQERGFEPENMRVLLDGRATAANIWERIEWLLHGVQPGDQRILYFSGHGAQLPGYGTFETIDRVDECLVPFDFDWTLERAVVDSDFYRLYAQLPYDAQFLAIFDCCHSGGMTRNGAVRARGLEAPDDIRHRMLQWDDRGRWEPRLPAQAEVYVPKVSAPPSTRRLGLARHVRQLPKDTYDVLRERRNHYGPYMPLLFYACRERELAYEHRVGAQTYGAFTWSLARTLRQGRAKSYEAVARSVATRVSRMGYPQRPTLIGPKDWLKVEVPS